MTRGKWFLIFCSVTLAALGVLAAATPAWAYPLSGSTTTPAFGVLSFDFGTQFQNLFLPFTTFVNNLMTENTNINVHGVTTTVTLAPQPNLKIQLPDWLQGYIDKTNEFFGSLFKAVNI
jgi:hypothetical protein